MSAPFGTHSIPRSTVAILTAVAGLVSATHPALAMFSGEMASEEAILPAILPIVSTFMAALVAALLFFIVSHLLSRR